MFNFSSFDVEKLCKAHWVVFYGKWNKLYTVKFVKLLL